MFDWLTPVNHWTDDASVAVCNVQVSLAVFGANDVNFSVVFQTPHQQTDKLDLHSNPSYISAGGGFGPVGRVSPTYTAWNSSGWCKLWLIVCLGSGSKWLSTGTTVVGPRFTLWDKSRHFVYELLDFLRTFCRCKMNRFSHFHWNNTDASGLYWKLCNALSCCRLTNYELLRLLVETPSRDFAHYRLSGGRPGML